MIKNIMKRQVFFIQLSFTGFFVFVLFCFVLFLRKRLLQFLCYLFMYENVQGKLSEAAVHRCSSKLVFLKISQYLQENSCVGVSFFIKLQAWRSAFLLKKRFQHRCFPVNIAKFLRAAFLRNNFCSLYFSEILCDERILWTSLGTKLAFFIFLVLLLCFLSQPQCQNRHSMVILYLFSYQNFQ